MSYIFKVNDSWDGIYNFNIFNFSCGHTFRSVVFFSKSDSFECKLDLTDSFLMSKSNCLPRYVKCPLFSTWGIVSSLMVRFG